MEPRGRQQRTVVAVGRIEKRVRAREMRVAMTQPEAILWSCLRANGVAGYHFRRQVVIQGFIVDFYCHQVALVIEVDGKVHDSQVAYDRERDDVIRSTGINVLRFTNDEVVNNLSWVLKRIKKDINYRP
ncbi:MAG TPA: endonuclease domain-containing protein [Capsulimonadaceae bacterium]